MKNYRTNKYFNLHAYEYNIFLKHSLYELIFFFLLIFRFPTELAIFILYILLNIKTKKNILLLLSNIHESNL